VYQRLPGSGGRLTGVAVEDQLKAYAERVDVRLEALLPPVTERPEILHEAIRYSCLAPGKRLRPAMCMAAAEAAGGEAAMALDAGCAIEMVHAFSLIHDDLPAIDDDDLRRGRPTCHVKFTEGIAILAGDALFSLAFSTMATSSSEAARSLRAVQVLARSSIRLVEGETADILSEGTPVDIATLEFIHANKTGALIAASCEIGAILAGTDPGHVGCLRDYGAQVGLAFQIADDLLNETSTPERLGKAAGSDRERGKATYPALFGIEGSRKAALDAAERGLGCLEGLPGDTSFLRDLAIYTVERLH